MNTVKIGVLLTNNDHSTFARGYPSDGEKVKANLLGFRPEWQVTVLDCVAGQFPATPEEFDGYVITGSPASVHDPEAWIARLLQLIRELENQKIPQIGLCFGHQAIAKALGGEVARNAGRAWGLGQSETYFSDTRPWMTPQKSTLSLWSAHNEQVPVLPQSAISLGGSDFCPNACFVLGEPGREHVFTTQYHPEFSPVFMKNLIEHLDVSSVGEAMLVKARADTLRPVDSLVFIEWMVNFLENGVKP